MRRHMQNGALALVHGKAVVNHENARYADIVRGYVPNLYKGSMMRY